MAQATNSYGHQYFPILFEDGEIQIYKNHVNEIFVEDKLSCAKMRIKSYPYQDGGLQFTTDSRVEPTLINNMIGWRVVPR